MAQYSGSIISGLLILTLSTCCINGLTLDEQLEQLRNNYVENQKVLEDKVSRLEGVITQMGGEIAQLKIHQQGSLSRDRISGTSGIQYPTCCNDLLSMGHTLSGVYSVIGNKSVETVFCDFYKPQNQQSFQTFQKWIGYADVKSKPVYFYVQRESDFSTMGVPIPFQLVKVNIGGAMDVTKGTFTAPVKGTYFFSFIGASLIEKGVDWAWLGVSLMLNGNQIGLGHAEGHTNSQMHQWTPFSIQSTLDLNGGDLVWLQIKYTSSPNNALGDSWNQHTHFSGMLLEEDIYQSL